MEIAAGDTVFVDLAVLLRGREGAGEGVLRLWDFTLRDGDGGNTVIAAEGFKALWGRGLIDLAAFSTLSLGDVALSSDVLLPAGFTSISSPELLRRLRVPTRGGEEGFFAGSMSTDRGRNLGRADPVAGMMVLRGRKVALLDDGARDSGSPDAVSLTPISPSGGASVTFTRVDCRRVVRLTVEEGDTTLAGFSPTEFRRPLGPLSATTLSRRALASLDFLDALSAEDSLASLFITSARALLTDERLWE